VIHIIATSRSGTELKIAAEPRDTLMQVLRNELELGVRADCGGNASCATCHVFIRSDWIDVIGEPHGDDERELLDGLVYAGPLSRLACQIDLNERYDGLAVEIAPDE
jgi:2Fe-2S ferredoxin